MANWCETYLTFQDNGVEQGRQALSDLYLTNDEWLLPRYILNISIASLTDMLKFPDMFNQQLSYGPFMYLARQDGIQIYQKYKYDYSNRKFRKFNNIEYYQDFEGDETDILTQIEESGLGRFSSLNNAIESLNANGAEILQDEYFARPIQPSQAFLSTRNSEED